MVRNLDYLKSKDPRLYEALHDILAQQSAIAEQVNGNVTGQPLAPPSVSGVQVSAQNGHFQVAIQDENPIYRDVHYYIEHADNPAFTNAQVVHNGHSRNWGGFLGNVTRYFRAYSSYASSGPGSPAYHGGSVAPQPVNGGGAIAGPDFLDTQGSGTGFPGQGISGPGPIPFRAVGGKPPVRGENAGAGAGGGNPAVSPSSVGLPPSSGGGSSAPGGGGSAGVMQFVTVLQAGLAALAATLTVDSLVTAYVSDFDHNLIWTGSGWRFSAGERSGYIQPFLIDPNPTTGWQLCDGTQVTFLQSDGTLKTTNAGGVVPIPDLIGNPAYLKFGGTPTGAVVAPVAPGLTMNSYTPAGVVSQPSFTGNAMGTHSHQSPIGITASKIYTYGGGFGGGSTFTTSASVAISADVTSQATALTSADSAGTPSGTVSRPTFTGTPATLTGTISTTGEPQNLILRPWFRR